MDLFAIESLADAEKAITTIKQQGEGTSTSPVGDPGDPAGTDNLAHYYKFAEIYTITLVRRASSPHSPCGKADRANLWDETEAASECG